jgi:DNA/RNA endonuclease YhcR with UshA esterase domain
LRGALALTFLWLLPSGLASAACMPITEAPKKIGADACVTGTVFKVQESEKGGAWFLDFCQDYRQCPFTVVVFARDLRDVGDVRQLQGKTIELWGRIRSYGGRAEIILRNSRQLRGEAAKLPPLPKDYDVTRRGRYSATAPSGQKPKRPTGGASKVGALPGAPGTTPASPDEVEKPETPR